MREHFFCSREIFWSFSVCGGNTQKSYGGEIRTLLGENCCWSRLGLKGLIIKESGDGGSDGKGRTSTPRSRCMLSPPIINPLVLLACLQLSQIGCSPLSLGKSCGGGSVTNVFVRVRGGRRRLLTRLFTGFYFSSIFQ